MELLLSAISAGGLSGAANQYLCLIIISITAKLEWIDLAQPVGFMSSWWFMGVVAVFWLLTILPAYGSLLNPVVLNVVNTIVNFLSGFLVPISAALLALASVGIIAGLDPELYDILRTLQIFTGDGQTIGTTGWIVAGGGALTASVLTGTKFLAKPAVSTATGVTGTISAPAYATAENVASVLLMVLVYVLSKINPWLLVGLLALVLLAFIILLAWAIYQLWKLGKGIGQVIRLIETNPKAGLSVVAEFLAWGSGWLIWQNWNRGIVRLILWLLWLVIVLALGPAAGAALMAAAAAVPVLVPVASMIALSGEILIVVVGLYAGSRSARALLQTFDEEEAVPGPSSQAAAAA